MTQDANKDLHNQEQLGRMVAELRRLEAKLRAGGGPEKVELQHRQGKLTARERIERLCDPGSRFLEIGLLIAFDDYQGQAPSAGVVTGIGLIDKREVVIVANDATVKAGVMWPDTVKKILRVQEIAMRCRVPIIYLVDSAGAHLPYQSGVFPGQYGGARVFYYNSIMRRYLGIPQIAAVMGPCIAGGAYLPALSDFIVMVEPTSFMGLGGPSLVKAATGQTVEAEKLGGAYTHTAISGVAHYRVTDDQACLERIRRIVSALPQTMIQTPAFTTPRRLRKPSDDKNDGRQVEFRDSGPTRDLIRLLLDQRQLEEFQTDRAISIITGYARIAGIPVGVIADQRQMVCAETDESPRSEAAFYIDSAEKLTGFIEDCNHREIPILFFLHDVSQSATSVEEDWQSINARARFIEAMTSATVPRIVISLYPTSATGFFTMAARVFDPDFVFALPTASVQNGVADKEQSVDASHAAARGFVDAVITSEEMRPVLEFALRTALNNPRRSLLSFVLPDELV